jgi:uncharacterized protein with NAD-binding domain and iron-sulfur cluster
MSKNKKLDLLDRFESLLDSLPLTEEEADKILLDAGLDVAEAYHRLQEKIKEWETKNKIPTTTGEVEIAENDPELSDSFACFRKK